MTHADTLSFVVALVIGMYVLLSTFTKICFPLKKRDNCKYYFLTSLMKTFFSSP